MKKYKHKITGDIVELVSQNKYYACGTRYSLPVNVVENTNDWEEVVELCVPIGTKFRVDNWSTIYLIKGINSNGKVYVGWSPFGGIEYEVETVNSHFSSGAWKIYDERPVLFTTEDGVEVRENDPIYEVNDLRLHNNSCSAGACINYHLLKTKGILYFSTKEAAQKYIDDNKPVYSKKQAIQMLRAFDKAITDYDEGGDDGYIEFLL